MHDNFPAIEGHVEIFVDWDGTRIRKATVGSSRPSIADLLLKGRPVEEAPIMVGRLFSLCGASQEVAARLACGAAEGKVQEEIFKSSEWDVVSDLLREHVWRVLVDWPQRLGLTPEPGHLQMLLRGLSSLHSAAAVDNIMHFSRKVDQIIFGENASGWFENGGLNDWKDWAESKMTSTACLMNEVWQDATEIAYESALLPHPFENSDALELIDHMTTNPGFCKQPSLHGQTTETGSLARMVHHPALASLAGSGSLLARMLSRLAEIPVVIRCLVQLAKGEPVSGIAHAMALSEGEGCAWVETSRGLLMHRVKIHEGRISQYQILAPTEWNFRLEGPCQRAISSIQADSEQRLRRSIDLVVMALDPCVRYQVEIHHA